MPTPFYVFLTASLPVSAIPGKLAGCVKYHFYT